MKKDLTLYWSRSPGKFVNKTNGEQVGVGINGLTFYGTVREWYETLVETVIDLRNQLQRDAGRDSREINISVSPDVRHILESTVLFKPQKGPRGLVGTLINMNILESKNVNRFDIEMEFKCAGTTKNGKVIILEN